MNVNRQKVGEEGLYRLDFFDDFDNHTLDRNKWIPYYLPQWSSRAASQPFYRIEKSALVLEIANDQKPWCPEFNGSVRASSLQTGLYAGALNSPEGQHRFSPACRIRELQTTERLYTPQHGYFEMRAKCAITPRNVAAFWMIGFEDRPERSAEICIFELKGSNLQSSGATIGFGVHPFGDQTIVDEFYEEYFGISVGEYNVYAAEWTESLVNFYINDQKIKTIRQSPAYPMQFMLNIYDVLGNDPGNDPGEELMEFVIDYVAGYQMDNTVSSAPRTRLR